MRSGPLLALQSVNIQINTLINRHAWVSWLFLYLAELLFFSAFRLSYLALLVETSTTPDEDSTAARIFGALLGILEDFVVISFLVALLWGFDAAINRSTCCNDTAPNGCLDCFTQGVPFLSRTKLIFKRLLRLAIFLALFLLSVVVFVTDNVVVRTHHHRYKLGSHPDSDFFRLPSDEESRTIDHVLAIVLVVQGVLAVVTTIWLDLTRWTPLRFAKRWKSMDRRTHELPTVLGSRPSVNYLVMSPNEFFDSDDNENLSEFFDSENRPIRGTQPPQPRAILSDDHRDLPTPTWQIAVFGFGLAVAIFLAIPLLVLLITSYCSPAVASIALNANLNEPIRITTSLSLVPG
ncbi:hypothetical protein BBJ28_00020194 [Nothophytophthora sp. Chile5]|nr:hypothetical protein BBJ28_00020194 [Nothophytophthora sp. Chile5]